MKRPRGGGPSCGELRATATSPKLVDVPQEGDLAALKLALMPKEGEAAESGAADARLAARDEDGRTV